MSFSGPTFRIPCDRGGFTHNPNIDNIDPVQMVEPSRNINLHNGIREPRGGTSKVNAVAAYGGSTVMGGKDYKLVDGSQFSVVMTTDGKIWKNTTTTIKTGLTPSRFPSFKVWNNVLYIANGADIPQVWDGVGAGTTDLTNVPTDWSANSTWPQVIIIHGRGNSERMWMLGAPEFPFSFYGSDNNDGISEADFSDANVLVFLAPVEDGEGLVSGVEFGDRLFVASSTKFFRLDDDDLTTTNWGLTAAQWEGGVAGFRLIVKTPNNLLAMNDSGDIYAVSSVQDFGDYKQTSIARPAFIDRWIREFIDLSRIAQFHGIYNQTLRSVDWFMVKNGSSEANIALRYFIDRPPQEAWMPMENADNPSGYNAACSFEVKTGAGSFKIYTGDYAGFLWELETANINDDSAAYFKGFRTPDVAGDNPRVSKKYFRTWLVTQPEGDFSVQVERWIDSRTIGTSSISLGGTGAVLGSFVLGMDVLGGNEIINTSADTRDVGKRIRHEVFNTNVNEDFKITELLFDFKDLGGRPQ